MVKVAESWQKNPHPHLKECEISPSFIMRTPFGNPWPHKNHGFKDILGWKLGISAREKPRIIEAPDHAARLAESDPSRIAEAPAKGWRISWLGHASFLVQGDGLLASRFQKPPANLVEGPFIWSAAQDHQDEKLAKIIKFGIPGTDMPGHETLSDQDIASLRAYLLNLRAVQNGK
jgi:hypothetical protein